MGNTIVLFEVTVKNRRMDDFADYKITVVTPIRSYTMTDRAAAPVDSNAYLEV